MQGYAARNAKEDRPQQFFNRQSGCLPPNGDELKMAEQQPVGVSDTR